MSEHTPLPWVMNCGDIYHIAGCKAKFTGISYSPPDDSCPAEVNAEFAVRAVNSHDALVTDCTAAKKFLDEDCTLEEYDRLGALLTAALELANTEN